MWSWFNRRINPLKLQLCIRLSSSYLFLAQEITNVTNWHSVSQCWQSAIIDRVCRVCRKKNYGWMSKWLSLSLLSKLINYFCALQSLWNSVFTEIWYFPINRLTYMSLEFQRMDSNLTGINFMILILSKGYLHLLRPKIYSRLLVGFLAFILKLMLMLMFYIS